MKICCSLTFLLSMMYFNNSYAAAGDMVTTASKVVANVRLQDSGTSATYYFVAENGGWDVAGCPGVAFAYLDQNSKISQAALSAALTSKTASLPISFHGICGNGSGNTQYLQIKYVVF